MPLTGEKAWWAEAISWEGGYTASWTVEMPPSAVFARVSPVCYLAYDPDVVMMHVGITTIRRRRPDDSDETLNLKWVPAVYEPKMTSITFSLNLYNCLGRILCDLGFWG